MRGWGSRCPGPWEPRAQQQLDSQSWLVLRPWLCSFRDGVHFRLGPELSHQGRPQVPGPFFLPAKSWELSRPPSCPREVATGWGEEIEWVGHGMGWDRTPGSLQLELSTQGQSSHLGFPWDRWGPWHPYRSLLVSMTLAQWAQRPFQSSSFLSHKLPFFMSCHKPNAFEPCSAAFLLPGAKSLLLPALDLGICLAALCCRSLETMACFPLSASGPCRTSATLESWFLRRAR